MTRSKAVAGLISCLAAAVWGCAPAPERPEVRWTDPPAERKRNLEALAKTDPIALLEGCEKSAGRYKDYTCTFRKQERLGGSLKPRQTVAVTFRDSPFSVGMKWLKNAPAGDRLLYVEGKYDNNMLVRPSGLAWLVPTVSRKPDGPDAMRSTRRPVTLFGFRRGLRSLLEVYRLAKKRGDLKSSFAGYALVGERQTLVLVRELPDAEPYRPAAPPLTKVYIDLEHLVPILIEGFDSTGDEAKLLARYEYTDVKFNLGLTDEDFRPEKFDLRPPK